MKTLARASTVLVATVAFAMAGLGPASAYTTTGCDWGTLNINVDGSYTSGYFSTGLDQAISNYYGSTNLYLRRQNSSGNSFTAQNSNYGATGWEGNTNWSCFFGTTNSATARLNMYYLQSAPTARLKVVWLHELGHGLGLGHVSSAYRVMYTSASAAYNNGIRSLTSDETSGINALY